MTTPPAYRPPGGEVETAATPEDRHAAATVLFERGLVYFPRIGVQVRATPHATARHPGMSAEEVAEALIDARLAGVTVFLDEEPPGSLSPPKPSAPYADRPPPPPRWPIGQGQRPGMIDSSPAGRRLLATVLILAALAIGIAAVAIAALF